MGFLDNLENSLNSLERQEERDPKEGSRRQAERSQAISVQPWADKLKSSAYTKDLFDKAAVAGHRLRAKIYIAWLEQRLRLEARGRVLELKPTTDGIWAEYTTANGSPVLRRIDLDSDPGTLLNEWLSGEQSPVKSVDGRES
jgi:hypothetical protein